MGSEAEGARELANAALGHPVLDLGRRSGDLLVLVVSRLGDLGRLSVLPVLLAGLGGFLAAAGVGALDPAGDPERVVVGELEVHVLLGDAGEVAVQLEGRLRLPHVELGVEGRNALAAGQAAYSVVAVVSCGLRGILVEVVDETEESVEVGLVVESWCEDGHFDVSSWGKCRNVQTVGGEDRLIIGVLLCGVVCLLVCLFDFWSE